MRFSKASRACGKPLRSDHGYRFKQSGSQVILRGSHGRRLAACGRTATAAGSGAIRVGGKGVYRGRLKAKAAGGGLLVINAVALNAYVKGVVPNEMPSSWPLAALEAQAVAARSYALATSGGGAFDVYDDTRSQVYGGKDSETVRTNRATKRTAGEVVRHGKQVATTYFFSTSGGRTESVQYGFPGAGPVPYLKSVRDPYDGASPVPHVDGALLAGRDRVAALGALLRQAAEDQGPEAWGLPANRPGAGGRLAGELNGLRPGAPGATRPAEHLGPLPQALGRTSWAGACAASRRDTAARGCRGRFGASRSRRRRRR